MIRFISAAALSAMLLFAPPAATAQGRVPDTSMVAVGGDIGVLVPAEEFAHALTGGVFVDFYTTPRFGIRGSVYWMSPHFDREPSDSVNQTRIGVDAIYNWERGVWHPYLGAGLGAHLMSLKDNGRKLRSGNGLGVSLLAGVEYFLERRTVLKAEGRFNIVDDFADTNPSGLALMVGVKHYF